MNPEEWWKNFALGLELDASGTFVYNGIRLLHEAANLHHAADVFEILYNISVGIERLLKVAIVLVEHDPEADILSLEKSLVTHSSIALADRLAARRSLRLASIHREFLSLLSQFYSVHRYHRFSFSSIRDIDEERRLFVAFVCKHLQIAHPKRDDLIPFQNTDVIRKFVGKVVRGICVQAFRVVRERAAEMHIYTYELRIDSKAMRVFHGQRLDLIDEDLKRRELLLFLMNPSSGGPHIELLRSFSPLALDDGLAPAYVRALLNERDVHSVGDEVDELYSEVDKPAERHEFLRIMDDEFLLYDDDEAD